VSGWPRLASKHHHGAGERGVGGEVIEGAQRAEVREVEEEPEEAERENGRDGQPEGEGADDVESVLGTEALAGEPPDEAADVEGGAQQRVGDDERVCLRGEKHAVAVDECRPRADARAGRHQCEAKREVTPREVGRVERRDGERAGHQAFRCRHG